MKKKIIYLGSFIILILGIGIFVDQAFFKPTVINSFIASKIYSSPANKAFTDDNFYKCVVDAYNSENKTSLPYTTNLSDEQLKTISFLGCSGYKKKTSERIYNLNGIEKLDNVKSLIILYQNITNLNLSKNLKLERIRVANNDELSNIDISQNILLTKVMLYGNNITSLDLSKNTSLEYIDVSDNKLSTLNLENNVNLKTLYLFKNNLDTINLRNNVLLNTLDLNCNKLKDIDISNNILLTSLIVSDNKLSDLNISNNINLVTLYVGGFSKFHNNNNYTELASFDESDFETFTAAKGNYLNTLNLTTNTKLQSLNASSNMLTTLDLSDNIDLGSLYANNNRITNLDLSNQIKLTTLRISNNKLMQLNLTNNKNLTDLDLNDNFISTIDLSNTKIKDRFYVRSNNLKEIILCDSYDTENLISRKPLSNQGDFTSYINFGNEKVVSPTTDYLYYLSKNLIIKDNDIVSSIIDNLNLNNLTAKIFRNDDELGLSDVVNDGDILKIYDKNIAIQTLTINIFNNSKINNFPLYKSIIESYNKLNNTTYNYTYDLSDEQLNLIKTLNIDDFVNTLDGIEYLKNLENLSVKASNIVTMNFSDNPKLKNLFLYSNSELQTLDVSNNLLLESLYIFESDITSLNLINQKYLKDIYIHDNNVNELILSANDNLEKLYCYNTKLENIDVSFFKNLKYLDLGNNNIKSIDLTNNRNLTSLNLSGNELLNLNLIENIELKKVLISSNYVENIDVRKLSKLQELTVSDNPIKKLDISSNVNLVNLKIDNTFIENLNTEKNEKLEKLYIYGSNIKNIDLSNNLNLLIFDAGYYIDSNNGTGYVGLPSNAKYHVLENVNLENNEKLEEISLDHAEFVKSLVLYKRENYNLEKLYSLKLSNIFNNGIDDIKTSDNKIMVTDKIIRGITPGETNLYIDYTYNLTDDKSNAKNYSVTFNVNIIEVISDLYKIGQNYIYVGLEDDEQSIIDNIDILGYTDGITKSIEGTKLILRYNNQIVKSFDIVSINGDKYDLNKEYIFDNNFDIDNIKVINGTSEVNNNELLIKYEDVILSKYKLVSYNSTKYDLSKEYIFDNDFDIGNIKVINCTSEINNNELLIKYGDIVLSKYKLVSFNSTKYDLSKEYIFDNNFDINNIKVVNGTSEVNNNQLLIKYEDVVLNKYNLVSCNSTKYDLSKDSIKVLDNNIEEFISNIKCINCNVKIFDGNEYKAKGDFGDNDKLRILYGDEVLKEYSLTYGVNGISLVNKKVKLNLDTKNSIKLEYTISPKNADNKEVTWKSSNTDVVSVDNNGVITAKEYGDAVITVTTVDGNYSDTCDVNVSEFITYTITYKDGDKIYTEDYEAGDSVTWKSDITKKGYTLVGWKYNDKEYKLSDEFTMINENITVTSIWNINKYTITYEVNGGSINNKTKEVIYDSKYGTLDVPGKKGYTFKGWYKENGFISMVDENTIVSEDKDHTLYAKWEINSYKLTINDGINTNEYTLKYNDEKEIVIPERKGYSFVKWNITGTDSSINNNIFKMGTEDSALVAEWKLIIPEIKNYKVKDKYITDVKLNTSINDFDLGLDNIYSVRITNKLLDNGLIGTGNKVNVYLDNDLVVSYIAVVKGDTTGDGKVSVGDVAKLYQYLKKKITMEEHFVTAGNVVDVDNEIKVGDVAKLYQYVKGKISSLE